ncbi:MULTISPECIES: acyl-CoA carboxylase epsilon subunit [unclassified Streptomyces]|uniref:acyl-CoA carboxylase epsilon subunit n=1 Tax=unclassified Streptomyces TaxID=2593676 RepID=UPI00331A001A
MPLPRDQREIPAGAAPLLRVEKGHAEPDELAAIVVALLARARAAGPRPVETVLLPATVDWDTVRRPSAPHSWQTVT